MHPLQLELSHALLLAALAILAGLHDAIVLESSAGTIESSKVAVAAAQEQF
jgi:hypothetical protein